LAPKGRNEEGRDVESFCASTVLASDHERLLAMGWVLVTNRVLPSYEKAARFVGPLGRPGTVISHHPACGLAQMSDPVGYAERTLAALVEAAERGDEYYGAGPCIERI